MRRLAPLLLLVSAGCAQIGLQARPVPMNHREVRLSSGVTCEDLFLGEGIAASRGDEVELDYTLWLEDGTRIDSTLDRGVPETIVLGEGPIRGLDEGLVGIQAGGRRKLRVPPALGYGKEGVEGFVPPDATLVFEVHVLGVNHPR